MTQQTEANRSTSLLQTETGRAETDRQRPGTVCLPFVTVLLDSTVGNGPRENCCVAGQKKASSKVDPQQRNIENVPNWQRNETGRSPEEILSRSGELQNEKEN